MASELLPIQVVPGIPADIPNPRKQYVDPGPRRGWPYRMIDKLQRALAWLMNRVRVNRLHESIEDGIPVFVKQRRLGGTIVIWFGNRFLALAHSGSWMFFCAGEWIAWEVHCARLLYPDRPSVKAGPGAAVIVPKVSGISLRQLLARNEPALRALAAAARELRRAHQLHCSHYRGAWSHGDLHLDNILYDQAADRAVLIDFDGRHDFRLSPTERHGDDLKVMLLELIGLPGESWLQPATALIEEYREVSVLNELSRQLFMPRGFAKILWHVRTNGAPTPQVEERLHAVQQIIAQVAAPSGSAKQQARDAGEGAR